MGRSAGAIAAAPREASESSWRATDMPGGMAAEDMESEAVEAEELETELEDLSDEEDVELPVDTGPAADDEEESEW